LVFAFTMMSMVVSDLRVVGQVGTTIGLGLLFDTLIVRSFMTPSIAALMGPWFWWPQRVRQRPVPAPWPQPQQPETAAVNVPSGRHAGDESPTGPIRPN
jgi:RND superfamily putative drug exporter